MAEMLKTSKLTENLEKVTPIKKQNSTATNTECHCPYCVHANQSIQSNCPLFENLKASLNSHLLHHALPTLSHCMFNGRSEAPSNFFCQCQTAGTDNSRTGAHCVFGFNNNSFAGNYGCASHFVSPQLNQVHPIYIPIYIPIPEIKVSSSVKQEDKACQVGLYQNCESYDETSEANSLASYVSDHNDGNIKTAIPIQCDTKDIDLKTNTLYYNARHPRKDDIYTTTRLDNSEAHPEISELYLQIPQSPPDHDQHNEPVQTTTENVDIRRSDLRFYSATSIRTNHSNHFNPQLLMNQLIVPSKSMMDHFNSDRLDGSSVCNETAESLDSQRLDPNDDEDFDPSTVVHGENMRSFPRLSLPSRDCNSEHDKNAALMMLSLLTAGSDSSGLRKVLDGLITGVPPAEPLEAPVKSATVVEKALNYDEPAVPDHRFQQRPRLRKRHGQPQKGFKPATTTNSNDSLSFF